MKKQHHQILVVDDEELNVRFLSQFLIRKGFAAITAHSGEEALALVASESPDLVLLDAMMPQMDGFEVCRRLRANPETALLPVVMVTALQRPEDEAHALDAGADDFLPKPINYTELMSRIRSLMRIKDLHDELRTNQDALEEKHDQLLQLQHLRESLTQMLVHDLKNPLTGIMGCTELLTMLSENMTEKQISILKKLEDNTGTLLKMVTELLDVSRMEENKLVIRPEAVSVKEVFMHNIGELEYMIEKYQLVMDMHLSDDNAMVWADRDLLMRIIANLLFNAIKHSQKGGKLTLTCEWQAAEHRMCFAVTDTGEGIPVEYLEKIFEKFSQVDLKQRGLKSDRGLGLTFCKLAVEAHGGKIWAESELGKGSTFKFFIPSSAPSA
ncbi:MAG TPA: response regulator [bacterium]|nr:response regulator [bacterium]HNC47732.1 response regulator [bacterium]HNH30010.1 response regulator [bacterium]